MHTHRGKRIKNEKEKTADRHSKCFAKEDKNEGQVFAENNNNQKQDNFAKSPKNLKN